MNLRTDEIGQAENTLKELYTSLVKKKEKIDEEYSTAREEANRLSRVQSQMQNEINSIVKAYKEITGKEL